MTAAEGRFKVPSTEKLLLSAVYSADGRDGEGCKTKQSKMMTAKAAEMDGETSVSSSLGNFRFPNKDKKEARIGKAKTSTVNDSRRGETGKEINRTKQMQGNKSMDNRSEAQ